MIVARIEIWPHGDSRALREIDRVTIVNVGAASEGNHLYEARHAGLIATFRHRCADGAAVLLTRALAALVERGEPDPLSDGAAREELEEQLSATPSLPGLQGVDDVAEDDAQG